MLERYLAIAPFVELKGPTSFAPLIELAMEVREGGQRGSPCEQEGGRWCRLSSAASPHS